MIKKYMIDIITSKYPIKPKRKYSIDYYLDNILLMLYDIIKWKSLSLIHKNKYTYHWKTIYNEFNKWSNDKVFELAFNKFVFNEYFKISKVKKDKKN